MLKVLGALVLMLVLAHTTHGREDYTLYPPTSEDEMFSAHPIARTAHARAMGDFFAAHPDAFGEAAAGSKKLAAAAPKVPFRTVSYEEIVDELEPRLRDTVERVRALGQFPVTFHFLKMANGVELFTLVFQVPDEDRKVFTVLDRSPYGQTLDNVVDIYLPLGFTCVGQMVQGTSLSTGNFSFWHEDAAHAKETALWIAQQEWSDGLISFEGLSADSMQGVLSLKDPPTNLVAATLGLCTSMSHSLVYQNGAFRDKLVRGWLKGIHNQRPDTPPYVDTVLDKEPWSEWWEAVNIDNFAAVHIPIAFWAGFEDIFAKFNLDLADGVQHQGSFGGKKSPLVVGPLGHCILQDYHRPYPEFYRAEAWWYEQSMYTLLTAAGEAAQDPPLDALTIYVIGANETNAPGNYWTTLPDWPAYTPTTFYLAPDGALARAAPSAPANRSYVFDPHNPVPSIGGNNLNMACGAMAQNPVESRSDVLLFDTPVFSEPMAIVSNGNGSMSVTLYVESDRVDTDFVVVLTDVFPSGESILLTDDIIRMRWRETTITHPATKPSLLVPGTTYEVTINLWPISYIVAPGHKLRLRVTSSNYPRFSVNPGTGQPIEDFNEAHMLTQTNTVHFGGATPSSITFPVVNPHDIPYNLPLA